MTKKQAINLFGKTQVELAAAMGKTKAAINQWPDTLTKDQERMVIGEAILQGKKIPAELMNRQSEH